MEEPWLGISCFAGHVLYQALYSAVLPAMCLLSDSFETLWGVSPVELLLTEDAL